MLYGFYGFEPILYKNSGYYAPVRFFSKINWSPYGGKSNFEKNNLHVLDILYAFEQGQDQTHVFYYLTRERGLEPPTFSVTN